MQEIHFHKMEGLGNDYVYVDCTKKEIADPEKVSIAVSDRHFGIGADGLILICPSQTSDFRMKMYNADGSEGNMCGNGIRCVGKFIYDLGLSNKEILKIETKAGEKVLELNVKNNKVETVRVDMGEPILEAAKIPVLAQTKEVIRQEINIAGEKLEMTCVSMGNPHAVIFVKEITDHLVLGIGPQIEKNPLFPSRVNTEFVEVLGRKELKMRVWERGSGETLACGTGACAVAVAAVLNEFAEREVTVHLLGGDLKIEWAKNNHVFMTGPAKFVFEGTIRV